MIDLKDLKKIAKARLKDAEILHAKSRYDGAVYLCGYAIETALKVRVCKTLHWIEFPYTPGEFKDLQSFKTHNLDVLLKLSGIETKIKTQHLADWSEVAKWNPELRYKPIGSVSMGDCQQMIGAAKRLLGAL